MFWWRSATLVSENISANDIDTLLLRVGNFWLLLRAGLQHPPNTIAVLCLKSLWSLLRAGLQSLPNMFAAESSWLLLCGGLQSLPYMSAALCVET